MHALNVIPPNRHGKCPIIKYINIAEVKHMDTYTKWDKDHKLPHIDSSFSLK